MPPLVFSNSQSVFFQYYDCINFFFLNQILDRDNLNGNLSKTCNKMYFTSSFFFKSHVFGSVYIFELSHKYQLLHKSGFVVSSIFCFHKPFQTHRIKESDSSYLAQ